MTGKRSLIEIHYDRVRGKCGAAVGHDVWLAEDLERADEGGDHDEQQWVLELWDRDVTHHAPAVRPVELSGLVEPLGNVLSSSGKNDKVESQLPPDGRDGDRRHRERFGGEPVARPGVVGDKSGSREEVRPQQGGDRDGEDVGAEEDCPEQPLPLDLAVDPERE